MNRERIKEKLDEIKAKVSDNNCEKIKELSEKECLQIYSPKRTKFLSSLLFKIRRRFSIEVKHVIELELEKSKEINLRLPKEIEYLKERLNEQDRTKEKE